MKPKTTKSKAKRVPAALAAHLKRAPRFAGWRLLKPTESAREGDRFGFFSVVGCPRGAEGAAFCPEVGYNGNIRAGRSLLESHRLFTKHHGPGFDGVLYRKLEE